MKSSFPFKYAPRLLLLAGAVFLPACGSFDPEAEPLACTVVEQYESTGWKPFVYEQTTSYSRPTPDAPWRLEVVDYVQTAPSSLENVTRYSYDDRGRAVKREGALSAEASPRVTTTWEYDGSDRVTRVVDTDLTTGKTDRRVFTYDDAGRLETVTHENSDTGASPDRVDARTYDDQGRLVGLKEADPADYWGARFVVTYDDRGNPAQVEEIGISEGVESWSTTTRITWDATLERIARVDVDNAWQEGDVNLSYRYVYDDAGRLVQLATGIDGETPAGGWFYTYDSSGNLVHKEQGGDAAVEVDYSSDCGGVWPGAPDLVTPAALSRLEPDDALP